MNTLKRIFMFLALSTTMIAMGMEADERRSTLESLRTYSTAELDREIGEVSEYVQDLTELLDAEQHAYQSTDEGSPERALLESRYFNTKNDIEWNSAYLELLREVRSTR